MVPYRVKYQYGRLNMKVRGNKFAVNWHFMVQPVSEPESLHSCVFSWGLVGQA